MCKRVLDLSGASRNTPVSRTTQAPALSVAHPLALPELLARVLDQFFSLPASRPWLKDKIEKGQDVAAFESTCQLWRDVVRDWLPHAPDKFRLRAARGMFGLRMPGNLSPAQRLEAACWITNRYRVLVGGYDLDYHALAKGSDWRIHTWREGDATRALALAASAWEKSGKGKDDEKDRPLQFDNQQLAALLSGDDRQIQATQTLMALYAGPRYSDHDLLSLVLANNRRLKQLKTVGTIDKNLLRGLALRKLILDNPEDCEDIFGICPTLDCLKLCPNGALGEDFWSELLARDQLSGFKFDLHENEHDQGLYDYFSQSKNLRKLSVYFIGADESDDSVYGRLFNGLAANNSVQNLVIRSFGDHDIAGLRTLLLKNNSLKVLTLHLSDNTTFKLGDYADLAYAFRCSPSLQAVDIQDFCLDPGYNESEEQAISFIEGIFASAVKMAPALQRIDFESHQWRKGVRKNDRGSTAPGSAAQQ